MQYANFPRVSGCVDGVLFKIDAPTENESHYVDRKGNHSINAMMVAGPDLTFYYVSAKWPGSVADARVLRCSSLCTRWENGFRPFSNAILLGDSAYPLKTWLIPPLIGEGTAESNERFLRSHRSTRRLVECAYGMLSNIEHQKLTLPD